MKVSIHLLFFGVMQELRDSFRVKQFLIVAPAYLDPLAAPQADDKPKKPPKKKAKVIIISGNVCRLAHILAAYNLTTCRSAGYRSDPNSRLQKVMAARSCAVHLPA